MTEERNVRNVVGTLAQASIRHNEYLEIGAMSVGEPGSMEPATSQPIIRIDIEEQYTDEHDKTLRMGTVSARPVYDTVEDDDITEETLEKQLQGYTVHVELMLSEERDWWPPFGIDYESHGFTDAGDDDRGVNDFLATTDTMPFEDAVELVAEMMSVLRDHRER